MTQNDKTTQRDTLNPQPEDEVAEDLVAQARHEDGDPATEDGGEAAQAENEYGGYEAASLPKDGEGA